MRVQVFVIYKNFASIKCHDFEIELHFASIKLLEEKRNLFNQIKRTLARFQRGKICAKVYNLLLLKYDIIWQNNYSLVSNFLNKEISVILRVQKFASFGQFCEIHEVLYPPNLISVTYYCQLNLQCALLQCPINSQSCVKTTGFALTILLLEKLFTINKLRKSIPVFQLHIQLVAVSAIISLLHVV